LPAESRPTHLKASEHAGQIVLSWYPATPGDVLQSSQNLGDWTNIPYTTQPVTLPADKRAEVFRVRVQ